MFFQKVLSLFTLFLKTCVLRLSLGICTVLYVLFGHVLTGVASYKEFETVGKEASVVYAIDTYMHGYHWLATLVSVAILAGFTSVILVLLLGQSRVFFSMSKDGLIPKAFSDFSQAPSYSFASDTSQYHSKATQFELTEAHQLDSS